MRPCTRKRSVASDEGDTSPSTPLLQRQPRSPTSPQPSSSDSRPSHRYPATRETGRTIVIAVGGGGIPVKRSGSSLVGIEAVIDKDFASAKLAEDLDADTLVILTEVERVALNFGKPDQVWLSNISIDEACRYMEEGHFAKGSMLPKIEACVAFVKSQRGRKALITSLSKVSEALDGATGTHITN